MSKAAAAPCSSCPRATSAATPEKSTYMMIVDVILEDKLPGNTDSVVKVKKFNN